MANRRVELPENLESSKRELPGGLQMLGGRVRDQINANNPRKLKHKSLLPLP